jgi:hypothetical protein
MSSRTRVAVKKRMFIEKLSRKDMLFTKSSGTGSSSSGGRSCTRMSQPSAGEPEGGKGQEAQHHLAVQALLHYSYLETLGQNDVF